jgi:flagellar export protein FliJ
MAGKQKYRLQPVMDMRERAKKDAAQLVAIRRQQLAAEEAELARRQRAVEICLEKQREGRTAMLTEIEPGAEARLALGHRTHLADLREQETILRAEVEKQEKIVEKAELEVEKAIEALANAAKEVKVIETHRDNWKLNARRQLERKEQKLNDEIGAILFESTRQKRES